MVKGKGGAMSRRKGATGELEVRNILREEGWIGALRGQQRSGLEQADVVGGPDGVHLEVKRVEKLLLRKAMEQAEADADGAIPVVVTRGSNQPWLAVIDFRELLRLIAFKEAHAEMGGS